MNSIIIHDNNTIHYNYVIINIYIHICTIIIILSIQYIIYYVIIDTYRDMLCYT